MSNRKKLKPIRRTKGKRRRRFRFNWKTALVHGSITALLLAFLVGSMALVVIQRASVWHWVVVLFITGMGIEIARAKLRAR